MKLVREFYENISFEEYTVSSSVKGDEIYLDNEILGEILKLSTIGELKNSRRDRSTRIETVIWIEDNGQFQRIYGRYLNIEIRLLHIIIYWIIQPRARGFDIVTKRDSAIMYHVVKCVPLNLPRIIIKVMQEAIARV